MTEAPWIKWNGGECPVPPETVVEVILRNAGHLTAKELDGCWQHRGHPTDVVTYRVVNSSPTIAAKSDTPNFSTRITEAEEKAEQGLAALVVYLADLLQGLDEQDQIEERALKRLLVELNDARAITLTAATLARDYARREV